MFTWNAFCIDVCWYRLLSTTPAAAFRCNSTTMRIPSRSDSSRTSEMPSIFFSLASMAIFSTSAALFTWYGSSVTTMRCREPPLSASSTAALARTITRPCPVSYASRMPSRPMIVAAVGKSGPCTKFISSSVVASGLSTR